MEKKIGCYLCFLPQNSRTSYKFLHDTANLVTEPFLAKISATNNTWIFKKAIINYIQIIVFDMDRWVIFPLVKFVPTCFANDV